MIRHLHLQFKMASRGVTELEQSEDTPGGPPNPFLSLVIARSVFFQPESTYHQVDILVNIDKFEYLSKAVYQQICLISITDPVISQPDFVRLMKTFLLKRLCDIYEGEKGRRHEAYMHLSPHIKLPGPLHALFDSIGQYHCLKLGVVFSVVPPSIPSTPPNWWTLDSDLLARYKIFVGSNEYNYTFVEMPCRSQIGAHLWS